MEDYSIYLPEFLRNLDPEIYLSNNFLVLDLETTMQGDNKSPDPIWPNNDIVSSVWAHHDDLPGQEQFIYGGIYDQQPLIDACYEVDYIVAHNGKFDIKWLIRAGIRPEKILLADTMLAEMVLTGNLKVAGANGGLSLGALCQQYFGVGKSPYVDLLMKAGVCPSLIPRSDLEKRNRKDVYQTKDLWMLLRDRLFDEDVAHLFFNRCLLSPALADIELRGVHLDKEKVQAEHKKAAAELEAVASELDVLLKGRNPSSPKQMAEFLYDELKFPVLKKRGVDWRPTGKEIFKLLKPKTQKQKKFMELKKEYAQLHADLSKNLDYFYGVVTEKEDCLFFAQFNQAQTKTHRLSSSGISTKFEMFTKAKSIQMQNSPRKYKPLYSAREEGWKIIEGDGAQIEFRVAGYIAQDRQIVQDLVDGVDIHTFTASQLKQCTEAEVLEQKKTAPKGADWRTLAKSETFKPIYGGQFGDGMGVGYTKDDQENYYAAFRKKYKGLTDAQRKWESTVLRNKCITHEYGITFHYPAAKRSNSGYNSEFPSICNYPVQGLATAEIVPIALVAQWHVMKAKEMRAFLINTVHDSVITEAPDDEIEELYYISTWAFLWWVYEFLDVVYGLQFNVPLGVGFQYGSHWGVGQEPHFTPERGEDEYLEIDGGEITVMAVPPVRMDGVDYSRLED